MPFLGWMLLAMAAIMAYLGFVRARTPDVRKRWWALGRIAGSFFLLGLAAVTTGIVFGVIRYTPVHYEYFVLFGLTLVIEAVRRIANRGGLTHVDADKRGQ